MMQSQHYLFKGVVLTQASLNASLWFFEFVLSCIFKDKQLDDKVVTTNNGKKDDQEEVAKMVSIVFYFDWLQLFQVNICIML